MGTATTSTQTSEWAEHAMIFVLGLIALVLLAGPVIRTPLLIPLNYNEGWNAYNTMRALGPGPLYPDPTALVSNNYPPLSFYIVGLFGYVVSDNIIAGRIVALVSLLVVALNVGLITRRLDGSTTIAWFAALLFLASAITRCRAYTGINDPQWMAHAFATTGLVVFLGTDNRTLRTVVAAMAIFAGGMVKHAVLPLPLAITVWLLLYDRHRLSVWLATSVLLVVGTALGLYAAYGANFFTDVFATARTYSLEKTRNVKLWIGKFALLLPGPFILAFSRPSPPIVLLLIYTLFSAFWGIFISFGVGVSINAMFDLYIALSIAAVLAIETLAHEFAPQAEQAARRGGMIFVMLPVLWALPENVAREVRNAQNLEATVRESREEIEYLAAVPGRAMCEELSLCYWAGKNAEVDFFNTGQKLATRTMDERVLLDLFDREVFDVVQLASDVDSELSPNRLPKHVLRRLTERYAVERRSSDGVVFLRPKRNGAVQQRGGLN